MRSVAVGRGWGVGGDVGGRTASRSGVNLAQVRKGGSASGFLQSAGGKGTTALQARAGALAEAIERYSGTFTGEEARRKALMSELGPDAVAPNSVQLFSKVQFADRERWNETHKAMHRVAKQFDSEMEIEWSPAWSLRDDQPRWLPTPLSHYGYFGGAINGSMADGLDQRLAHGAEPPGPNEPEAVWWAMESMDGQGQRRPRRRAGRRTWDGFHRPGPDPPGRLYDVPVELGWLDHPLTETDLNSTPIFW